MLLPNKYDFILGKIQLHSYCINTEKYDIHLPIKISKNRPKGVLPEILIMFKNGEDFNEIKNRFGIYLI
tara:strand:- start:470 stop:676 length:207 start_codon:yes stop_codon:yes gene_type:complete